MFCCPFSSNWLVLHFLWFIFWTLSPLVHCCVPWLVHLFSTGWNICLHHPPLVDSLPHAAVGRGGGPGGALSEVGETLHQVAVARDELDASVQHAFIDPLQELHSTELKEIRVRGCRPDQPRSLRSASKVRCNNMLCLFFFFAALLQHQLKKMNGRRLDLDYKRRRGGKVPAEEVEQARDKFLTSKELAESSMFVLLQNDVGIRRRNPRIPHLPPTPTIISEFVFILL